MKLVSNLILSALSSNFFRRTSPYKLTYAVTYKCNSRCLICNIWKKRDHQELSMQEVQNFFSNNNKFQWIDLTGGEVFLHPNLVSIVEVILETQKNLYLLHVPTNGIMTERIVQGVKKILSKNVNRFVVSISLDGTSPVHDTLRGIHNNWKRAVETYKELKLFKSYRFDCVFGMTISGYNVDQVEAMYLELKKVIPDLDRNDIHFNVAHHSSHYYANTATNLYLSQSIFNTIKEYNEKKRFVFSGVALMERMYQRYIGEFLELKKTPVSCHALRSSIFINPNGEVFPCGMWGLSLGNLREFDFNLQNMWNKEKTKKTISVIEQKKCPNCWTPCEAYQSILGNIIKPKIFIGALLECAKGVTDQIRKRRILVC